MGDAPRFVMLETIREYALERLAESGEEQAVRWRHAGYYSWLTASINVWSHPRGIAPIEDELDNLRAVLGWSVEQDDVLPGLVIISDWTFWGERANEGRRWLNMLLGRPIPISRAAAETWYSAASLTFSNNDYTAARAALETCFEMYANLGDPTHIKYFGLGYVALGAGDLTQANAHFEQLLVLADDPANPNRDFEVGAAHYGLGAYYLIAGNPVEAQIHIEADLAQARTAGRSASVTANLRKLAFAAQAQGDLQRAIAHLRESTQLAHSRHYRGEIIWNLFAFAGLALDHGELESAARLFAAAEAGGEMVIGMFPDECYLVERNIAALRERLDPATLAARWAEGRALDWEQAVEEALAFIDGLGQDRSDG